MPRTYFAINQAACDFTDRSTTPKFPVGFTTYGNSGTVHVYVLASEAVTGTCTVNTSTFALTDTAGNYTADTAFASGEYGFVRRTAGEIT
jgi:hypothetical protein